MQGIHFLILVLVIWLIWLETNHKLRPKSPLLLKTLDWEIKETELGEELSGWIEIYNPHHRIEVMVPELTVKPVLLGKRAVKKIKVTTSVTPYHSDEQTREDGYWPAYIVKSKAKTRALVKVHLENKASDELKKAAENIWLEINWVNYGPFGRLSLKEGILVPIKQPKPITQAEAYFKKGAKCQILPVKTHLLGPLDDLNDVINHYISEIISPGDIITIGETPLAITQGRYIHPSTIKPNILTRILCSAFHPTSSLATACGLQTLINIVGPSRVIFAWIVGIAMKCIGIKGVFYRLAGSQARLIDDITGTTPPYDQTIVLGPEKPKTICEQLSIQYGIEVAVVDVNDLGRVKILASSKNCNKKFLKSALRQNPAGNANEQTPIVLLRPIKTET